MPNAECTLVFVFVAGIVPVFNYYGLHNNRHTVNLSQYQRIIKEDINNFKNLFEYCGILKGGSVLCTMFALIALF